MGYGQHQSFHLRDRWLSKGLKSIDAKERFFYDDDAFEQIGLGKNMVQSLRFWVEATKVVDKQEGKKHSHSLSNLGQLILKYDKVVQLQDTASILHYNLTSDKEMASSWYWFFNCYNEKVSTKEEVFEELKKWVQDNETKNIAEGSIKKDVDCLVRLYTSGQDKEDPEEVIHSPIAKINIMSENDGYIYKKTPKISEVGIAALMYVLLDYCDNQKISTITVDEIEHKNNLWGKTFNLNRSLIVSALERLMKHKKYPIKFIRTNKLDDVQIPKVTALEFLEYEYVRMEEELNVLV